MQLIAFHNRVRYFVFLFIVAAVSQTGCIPIAERLGSKQVVPQRTLNTTNPIQKILAVKPEPQSSARRAEKEIYDLLMARDFIAIENIAADAHINKLRLPGGYWRIDTVFKGITTFFAEYENQEVTDEMWRNRIELLFQWKEKMPQSTTARIALGEAYIEWAWFARGGGFMDTVSADNRKIFFERLNKGEDELAEAKKTGGVCMRWYREMLYLAMINGWERESFDQLFEESISVEPNYLQSYLIKSDSLAPKWNGEKGEWQKYVDSLPSKMSTLETDEGDIVYFVVVANKLRDQSLGVNWSMISKERVKKGFNDIEKKYGADNFRLNQYALASIMTSDFVSAKQVFDRIGDNYDPELWNEKIFRTMKQVSEKEVSKISQQKLP